MTLPNKLILVGMKYQEPEAITTLRKECNASITGSISVSLFIEDNEAGILTNVNPLRPKAYAAYCRLPGIGTKCIGYVRNKDLSMLDFKANLLDRYVITAIQTNYIVIELRKSEIAKVDTSGYVNATTHFNDAVAATNEIYFRNNLGINANTPIEKKEIKMNTNAMRDSFFREVKNVVIDIQSGKLGVTSKDGIATFANNQVSVNPIVDFGIKIPAFAMRVEVTNLAEGDIIISGDESTFFKSKTESGYEVVTLSGEVRQVGSVSNMFFGKNTVLAVKNMFGEGTNPMMMAMLMGDGFGSGDKGDNKNMMLMMMAMSGGMGGSADNSGMGGMNPMMLAMLMSK